MKTAADPVAMSVAAFRLCSHTIEAQMRIGTLIARSCFDVMFASPWMHGAQPAAPRPARPTPSARKAKAPARKRPAAKPATPTATIAARPATPRIVASTDTPAHPPRPKPKRAPSPPPPMPERASTGTDEG